MRHLVDLARVATRHLPRLPFVLPLHRCKIGPVREGQLKLLVLCWQVRRALSVQCSHYRAAKMCKEAPHNMIQIQVAQCWLLHPAAKAMALYGV